MAFMFNDFGCFVLSEMMMVRVEYSYPGKFHVGINRVGGSVDLIPEGRNLAIASPRFFFLNTIISNTSFWKESNGTEVFWELSSFCLLEDFSFCLLEDFSFCLLEDLTMLST